MKAPLRRLTKREGRAVDEQIHEIYQRRCSGIQVPILALSEIFGAGREAYMKGEDVEAAVVATVERVRVK